MNDTGPEDRLDRAALMKLTAEVVSSYVGNRALTEDELDRAVDQLPQLIGRVHEALLKILRDEGGEKPVANVLAPAVAVEGSVTEDAIVCLEDGQSFKTLARHLQSKHGLTPEQYRAKWNLPADYPMACGSYAQSRSEVAKRIGLGVDGRGGKPAFIKQRTRKGAKRS